MLQHIESKDILQHLGQEMKFKRKEDVFYNKMGQYFDKAEKPLFQTNKTYECVQPILKSIPHVEKLNSCEPIVDKMFVPYTHNAQVFLKSGVKHAIFGGGLHKMYPVLLFVLKMWPFEFKDFVNGLVISNEKEYNSFREEFNKVYKKILQGRGNSHDNLCTKDELIRASCLFFLVEYSCENEVLKTSEHQFQNSFGGENKKVKISNRQIEHFSEKLSSSYMSDSGFKNFYYQYFEDTDDKSLWFIQFPKVMSADEDRDLYSLEQLIEDFNMLENICDQDAYLFTILQKDEQDLTSQFVYNMLHFEQQEDGVKKNEKLFLYEDQFGQENFVISNYWIKDGIFSKRKDLI